MSKSENGDTAAAYVSWGTFKNTIVDGMTENVPNVVDKSLFPGMAGGMQSHMMASLKFLGLIDDAGRPLEALHEVTVSDESARKAAMQKLIKSRYPAVLAIGLEKASMKQLLDTLESAYHVTGDTKEKAARFFIAACQYAGVGLSRHILDGAVSAGRPRRPGKRTGDQGGVPASSSTAGIVDPSPRGGAVGGAAGTTGGAGGGNGEARVVKLAGGGTLTLSASVGLMTLGKADRAFVFALIDQCDEYESTHADEEDAT